MKTKDRERFRGMLKGFENEIKRLKEQKNEKEKNITSMLFSETCPWMLMGMREQISIFAQKRQELTTDIAISIIFIVAFKLR